MNHFLVAISSSRHSLSRMVAIAAAGSAFLYANSDNCSKMRIPLSVAATLDESPSVDVMLQDGRTFKGTVINADSHFDIGIVNINSKTPLPTAKLGSSSKLRPGLSVIAIGCPHSLQNTITGTRSCVGRKNGDLELSGMSREYLQTEFVMNLVSQFSPASKAGFLPDDVVIKFDGKPVESKASRRHSCL